MGERPSFEQAKAAAAQVLDTAGMAENQAFFALHRDGDHHHIHIVAGRVHPEHLILTGPCRLDKICLEVAMGQTECENGFETCA